MTMKYSLGLLASAIAFGVNAGGPAPFSAAHQINFLQKLSTNFDALKKSNQSNLKQRAIVDGNLMLRDAHYRYHEPILPTGGALAFVSFGCDIYQLVINVTKGAATLFVTESPTGDYASILQNGFVYKDKLHPSSGMFSYTLYSNSTVKAFEIKNGDYAFDNQPAEVTAFGYCFSTKTTADAGFQNTLGIDSW